MAVSRPARRRSGVRFAGHGSRRLADRALRPSVPRRGRRPLRRGRLAHATPARPIAEPATRLAPPRRPRARDPPPATLPPRTPPPATPAPSTAPPASVAPPTSRPPRRRRWCHPSRRTGRLELRARGPPGLERVRRRVREPGPECDQGGLSRHLEVGARADPLLQGVRHGGGAGADRDLGKQARVEVSLKASIKAFTGKEHVLAPASGGLHLEYKDGSWVRVK